MSDAKQDVVKQITDAWKSAQAQLAELRAAVERTGEMAKLRVDAEFLHRDLDRALRDLGEAVWSQVKKGNLELPRGLGPSLMAVEEVERRQAEQASAINEILSEGTEVAGRLRGEKAKSAVAAKGKKR